MGMSLGMVCGLPWKKRWLGRCRVRGKRRRVVAPEICLDLLIEILARLPCKSLMRFKCVSKLWFTLIRSRFFTNLYHPTVAPRRVYMSIVEHIYCHTMMEPCPKSPGKSQLLSFSSSSSLSKFDKDLSILGKEGRNMVIFRGLILYTVCRKACIYNPTTRQSVTLPAVKSNIFAQDEYCKQPIYFLAHDPVLGQYKILCTVMMFSKNFKRITSEHWVFVLEPGGYWRRIEFDQPHHVHTRPGVCINGVGHYLAATSMSTDILVSFNVRHEEFRIIETPRATSSSVNGHVGFIEYDGKPAIVDYTHLGKNGLIDLWVLEDGEKWSKKSFVLRPCQMHLVDNDIELLMEIATPNGQLIWASSELHTPYYFLYYDMQKNDLTKVMVQVEESDILPSLTAPYYCFKHMDESESIMHLEI